MSSGAATTLKRKEREQPRRLAKLEPNFRNPRVCQWPALWQDENGLRPYYDFICELRWLLEYAERDVGVKVGSAFESWPGANSYWWRSIDGIYLQCEEHQFDQREWKRFLGKKIKRKSIKSTVWIKHLVTPFGKVALCPGGCGKELSKRSMRFMHLLRQHLHLERVDNDVEKLACVYANDRWRSLPRGCPEALYRIGGWQRGDRASQRSYTKLIFVNVTDSRNRFCLADPTDEIMKRFSGDGTDRFVAKRPEWFTGTDTASLIN